MISVLLYFSIKIHHKLQGDATARRCETPKINRMSAENESVLETQSLIFEKEKEKEKKKKRKIREKKKKKKYDSKQVCILLQFLQKNILPCLKTRVCYKYFYL